MLEPVSVHRVPSTDGVELAVYDYGGDGPTLLAGHATGFHGRGALPGRLDARRRAHARALAGNQETARQ